MLFHDTPERSAELLRQALPLMTRQQAALHPISYAVWYTYVARPQSSLRADVDKVVAEAGTLDEATTLSLFRRHIGSFDNDAAQRVAQELQQVIGGMSEQAARAQDDTERYGQQLRASGGRSAAMDKPTIDALLAGTEQMGASLGTLRDKLEESRREIDALRLEVERAREESMIDALTGLANRRAFDKLLHGVLPDSRADAPRAALLICDLDHFKRINDTYGHGFGDQVLRVVAQALKRLAPEVATVARYGGEEFAVVLPQTTLDGGAALAEKLRAAVAASRIRRKSQEEAVERVSISIGVALHHPGEAADAFIDRADRALYRSKSEGRDRVTVDR